MPIIHSDLSETINKTVWEVLVDDNANLQIPFYYRKYPERKPFYNSDGGMSKSYVTIDNIVTYCNSNIVFSICKVDDLISIYSYLESYSNMLKENIDSLPPTHPHVRYYNKCVVAMDMLKKMRDHFTTVNENNSRFKQHLQLTDILKNI